MQTNYFLMQSLRQFYATFTKSFILSPAERSDLYVIGRAAGYIGAFGVPWWVLTQVRDDGEFRMYLEDTQGPLLGSLRALFPHFVPHGQATCYRECERPSEEKEGGSGEEDKCLQGMGVSSVLPSLGLSSALGSLETTESLRSGFLVQARKECEVASATLKAASSKVQGGEVTWLYREGLSQKGVEAENRAKHIETCVNGWSQGAFKHKWSGSAVVGKSSTMGAVGRTWWSGAPLVAEDTLCAPGIDDEEVELWRARPKLWYYPAFPHGAFIERESLQALKSGVLWEAAEEATRNAPIIPPPPTPPSVPLWDSWALSLTTLVFGEPALALPSSVECDLKGGEDLGSKAIE